MNALRLHRSVRSAAGVWLIADCEIGVYRRNGRWLATAWDEPSRQWLARHGFRIDGRDGVTAVTRRELLDVLAACMMVDPPPRPPDIQLVRVPGGWQDTTGRWQIIRVPGGWQVTGELIVGERDLPMQFEALSLPLAIRRIRHLARFAVGDFLRADMLVA